jgi:hypothetical protein
MQVMSVDLSDQGAPGTPVPLFEFFGTAGQTSTNWFLYAPASDGQRLLVNRFETDARPQIHVLVNGRFRNP